MLDPLKLRVSLMPNVYKNDKKTKFSNSDQARLAQLVERRSHNPKVVSSILTLRKLAEYFLMQDTL